MSDARSCATFADGATGHLAPARFFDSFDAAVKDGRLDEAARALDCAELRIAPGGTWKDQHELMRRRGVLDYRQERVAHALQRFECALGMAESHQDRAAIARDLKNIGSALRRLGDFHNALKALTTSLELERAHEGQVGAIHNNIADVYRELDAPEEAFRHYRQALAEFRGDGNELEAAHVLESMSVLALDTGAVAQAGRWLEEALRVYQRSGHPPYQLRVYASLVRVALAQDHLAQAERWSREGLDLAAVQQLPLPVPLQLQVARVERLRGRPAIAGARLRAALVALPQNDVDRSALLEELSLDLEASGAHAEAMAALRQAHAAQQQLAKAQLDRQLGWLRSRFEAANRERVISDLQAQNRQRSLQLGLTLCAVLAGALAVTVVWIRRRQQARVNEALRQARHDQELARYRRETEELIVDRKLLQALLASRDDALCMLDSEGHVLTATRAACTLLAVDEAHLTGRAFAEHLREDDRASFAAVLERMEDSPGQTWRFARVGDGAALSGRLSAWDSGEGILVLALDAANEATAHSPIAAPEAVPSPATADATVRDAFRRGLVELMWAVVETWERSSGQSRLELAEQSRIWRVTNDDGRLRTRAMERYLALSKLPQQPRWRDVLRSAYFVLARCTLEPEARAALQARVDAVLTYTRRSALV